MGALLQLLACVCGSVALYFAVFSVVHRPLTIDSIHELVEAKRAIAQRTPRPRLVLLAGSNGRFSHSCAVLQRKLQRPCVNLSVAAGIGLDYVLAEYDGLLGPGDVLYLPLEYEQYLIGRDQLLRGPENALLFGLRRELLPALGRERALHALGAFDLSFLIQGAIEMGLQRAGVARRVNLSTLNAHGDEFGHTQDQARAYRPFVAQLSWTPPKARRLQRPAWAQTLLRGALARLEQRGVRVIGGLPTVFDMPRVDDGVVEYLRGFYAAAGAELLVLDNRSQYPRACFFDGASHLTQECQELHSVRLAAALRAAGAVP